MRTPWLAALLAGACALQVEPGLPDTEFRDAPFPSNADAFQSSGVIAVADTCPCAWSREAWSISADLTGKTLLVPQRACAVPNNTTIGYPVCTPAVAACVAESLNASGIIFACDFARSAEREVDSPKQCFVAGVLCNIPGVVVLNNVSAALASAAVANYTVAPPPFAAAPLNTSLNTTAVNGSAPAPPPQFWIFPGTDEYNATLSWTPEDGCATYDNVPLVYLAVVPIWWVLAMLWAWCAAFPTPLRTLSLYIYYII